MSRMVDGVKVPSVGLTEEECYGHMNPPGLDSDYKCERKHRDCDPFVNIDNFLKWLHHRRTSPGDMEHLRLGQSFCNFFNIHDPGLFYETEDHLSFQIMCESYIDGGYNAAQYLPLS